MRPVPQLEWLEEHGILFLTIAGGYSIMPCDNKDFIVCHTSWPPTKAEVFTDLQEAKDWCQQDYTARLKAAEKWTTQPPGEPGHWFILCPDEGLYAWTVAEKPTSMHWLEGTLFRKIDEPEEPYDFSNT